jgi:agmatine deiminase
MNPQKTDFRMPAEWEEHERTLISWPVKETMMDPADYESFCRGFQEIIHSIAAFEPVTVLVNQADWTKVRQQLSNSIELLSIEHNDAWLRDNGPTFLINDEGQLAGVNWQFNAWGRKWPDWELDNRLPEILLKRLAIKRFDAPMILEGGSIHVDGQGTLLTTEECLLHPNRNSELRKEQMEEYIKRYTHVKKIIWLKRGLVGDETDGHVDNVACFVAPGVILLQVCKNPKDANFSICEENLRILQQETDACGRPLQIIPIEQPPMIKKGKQRLPASYINFYFVNGGVILPLFGGAAEKTDQVAVQLFRRLFPNREICPVDGRVLLGEGGNVHCITQPIPRAHRKRNEHESGNRGYNANELHR